MKRKTTTQLANPLVAMMAGLAISAGTANAQTTLFYDDFENGLNDATVDDTTGSYSQTPDVAGTSGGNTTGQVNTTLWVKADEGYGSTRQGLVDEAGGDFTDPVGEQAWAFRYTNSGITTADGVIGALTPGATYTVSFDSVEDLDGGVHIGTGWSAALLTYDGGRRDDARGPVGATKVLTTATGNALAGGAYQAESFSYTVDPGADASVLGQDVVLRFYGATTSATIDNVRVEVTISGVAHWDINGSGTGAGGASPTGTWDASTTNWNPEPDGTGTTAAWNPGLNAIFAAGTDATGLYSVTVDGTQDISALLVEEGSVSLIDGTLGGLNMTASSPVVVVSGSELNIGVPFTNATGTEVLTKGGEGKLTISADNSGATGGMVLNSGITQFDALASINGSGANVLIGNNGIASFGGTIVGGDIPSVLSRIDPASTGYIAVDGYAGTAFDFSVNGLGTAYLAAIADTTLTGLHTPAGTSYRLGGAGGKLTLTDASGMDEASPTIDVLGDVEISGNITAVTGTLTKTNSGTLTLSGANSYSANTTASGGTLVLAGSNSAATQTTVNAATVQLASSLNGGLASGPVSLSQNAAVLQAVNADRVIANDVLLYASPTISGTQSLTINGTMTLNNNRVLTNSISGTGKSLTFAAITRDGTSNRNLTINGVGDTTVTGTVVLGTGILTKNGAGTLTLNGDNDYSGATHVNGGTLALVGGSQSAAITVASGASLGFTLGSPTTSTAAVDLTNGTVKITGTPSLSSHLLMTAAGGITGTPTLDAAITDYELVKANGDTELRLNLTGVLSAYDTWSGGAAFDGDANGDGVSNGLAFLFGASGPNASALDQLPAVTESGGGLVMSFSMRDSGSRGPAALSVEHSSDLGITDAWTAVLVPDSTPVSQASDVSFTVTENGVNADLNDVVATISSTEAAAGTLFGRLKATE